MYNKFNTRMHNINLETFFIWGKLNKFLKKLREREREGV